MTAICRSVNVQLRMTTNEKTALEKAASIAGAPLSVWIRERPRWAAIKELEAAAAPSAFLRDV
jgi:hypothetical protein